MIRDVLSSFHEQFSFSPTVSGAAVPSYKTLVVCGMGGSHLAADLLASIGTVTPLIVHHDYGLPAITDELNPFVLVCSYSGNTEEALDSFAAARDAHIPVGVIASGGTLLAMAKEYAVPHIEIPGGLQPRMATGYMTVAVAAFLQDATLSLQLTSLSKTLSSAHFEAQGKDLADFLHNKTPVFYSSARNYSVAYTYKIACNETGKIPAFANVLPEANHNEMNGFGGLGDSRARTQEFAAIFLHDDEDDTRVTTRMDITASLLQKQGVAVRSLRFDAPTRAEKIFSAIITAHWASYFIAQSYGSEPEQVPMVEELKSLLRA